MKWLLGTIALSMLSFNVAMAAPTGNFQNMVTNQGMEQAVVAAMAEGQSVNDIMIEAMAIEGINPAAIMTALLNAGAALADVTASAAHNNVSTQVIAAVRQQHTTRAANGEGGDTQAFTPANNRRGVAAIPTAGVPGGGGGTAPAENFASPSS